MNSKGKQHLQKSKKKVENIPLIWVNDMTNRKGKLKKQNAKKCKKNFKFFVVYTLCWPYT